MSTWIIVADNARARILLMDEINSPLKEIRDIVNPSSRLREQNLGADRPGRTFDSKGHGRHAKEGDVSIKKQEAINFTGEIAGFIDSACHSNRVDKLILVAPPEFLGILRKALSKTVKQHVSREIGKDLTRCDEALIRREVTNLPD